MMNLKLYKDYCEHLKEACKADYLVMAVHEEHLKKKLRGQTGYLLIGVYPSYNISGFEDNVRDMNTCLLYILKAISKVENDENTEIREYAELQIKIDLVKKQLIYDADNGLWDIRGLDRESIEIEPEFNITGGYYGYSLIFTYLC